MSERSKLEQVLEFLLAEDNERAEELLHEYVVETARQEYERILDEDEVVEETKEDDDSEEEAVEESAEETEEEAVEETIDQADPEADFISDVEEADDEIESDEVIVLVNNAEIGSEIDVQDAEQDLKEAKLAISKFSENEKNPEKFKALKEVSKAEARIQAAKN